MHIYHVAERDDWESAQAEGEYRISTRGKTVDEVGFIHCSFRYQIEQTVRLFYRDVVDDLVVLTIDETLLPDGTEAIVENLPGNDEGFPHLYGALPTSAVVAVEPFQA